MDLTKHIKNNLLAVKVIPNASQNRLIEEHNALKLYFKAVPEKDKANKELIKFFKDEFKLKVQLKAGAKSREKILQIYSRITI